MKGNQQVAGTANKASIRVSEVTEGACMKRQASVARACGDSSG